MIVLFQVYQRPTPWIPPLPHPRLRPANDFHRHYYSESHHIGPFLMVQSNTPQLIYFRSSLCSSSKQQHISSSSIVKRVPFFLIYRVMTDPWVGLPPLCLPFLHPSSIPLMLVRSWYELLTYCATRLCRCCRRLQHDRNPAIMTVVLHWIASHNLLHLHRVNSQRKLVLIYCRL